MRSHCGVSLRLDVLVNIRVLLCIILFCRVFVQVHGVHYGAVVRGWPWRHLSELIALSGHHQWRRHLLRLRAILKRPVHEALGVLVLLFNRFVMPLQVYVANVRLKRLAKRVRSIN